MMVIILMTIFFFILITTYIVNTNLTITGRSNHRCVRPKKTNTNKKAS